MADRRIDRGDLPGQHGAVGGRANQFELGGFQIAGDGGLGRADLVAGMAEGDAARRDVPALVLIGVDLLQFQFVDVEGGSTGRARLAALHAVGEIEAGDLVAREVGNLPHDVVPLVVLEDNVVHAHLVVAVRDAFRAFVVEGHNHGDYAEAGQVGIDPGGDAVPGGPVLAGDDAARGAGSVVPAGRGLLADGGAAQAERVGAADLAVGVEDHLPLGLVDVDEFP